MSPRTLFISLVLCPALCGAQELPSGVTSNDILTGNDRWGCELLLCLANPNGWATVSECKPPVQKYFDCRAKRHPCSMPKCPQAGGGNYATDTQEPFDPCKQLDENLVEAPTGWLAKGRLSDGNFAYKRSNRVYLRRQSSRYNHNGEAYSYDSDGYSTAVGSQACVKPTDYEGQAREPYRCTDNDGSYKTCYRTTNVYRDVIWQERQSARSIDVFIDGQLWHRVHW